MAVVVVWTGKSIACRHTSGDNADFLYVVAIFEKLADDCVSCFVICGNSLVAVRDYSALLLRSCNYLVDTLEDIFHNDDFSVGSCRKNSRLVEQVFEVCTAETARHSRKNLEGYVVGKRFVSRMYFENFLSALNVGYVDVYLSVKSAGSQKRGVEYVRSVGSRHYDNAFVFLEAVHLNEQLVERLLSFVVSAAQARTSLSAHRVYFVDKHDTRHIFLGLVKQVSYSRSTRTYEHLHEVRTAYREERYVGFARYRFGKQRLTRSGRAYEQNALGYSCTERKEFLGVFEEFYDFLEFLFLFLSSRNVRKSYGYVHIQTRLGLAEVESLTVGTCVLSEDNEYYNRTQYEREYRENQRAEINSRVGVVEYVLRHGNRTAFYLFLIASKFFEIFFEVRAVVYRGYVGSLLGRVVVKRLYFLLRRVALESVNAVGLDIKCGYVARFYTLDKTLIVAADVVAVCDFHRLTVEKHKVYEHDYKYYAQREHDVSAYQCFFVHFFLHSAKNADAV